MVALALDILILLPAAFLVVRLIRSPRPSAAGPALLLLILISMVAETFALM
jgi:hypothetical protein